MKDFTRCVFLLASLLFSMKVFSLSCSGIAEEFYFSCKDSKCIPEFQVSFKKSGGACARRPIVLDVNEGVGSYLRSEISHLSTSHDGIYKLVVIFRYWRYEPSTDVERLKNTLSEEYGYELIDPETGEKPATLHFRDLLSPSLKGVSFDFIDSFENRMIQKIEGEMISEQYSGLAKYGLYIVIYWGSFILSLFALVYSVNRFYSRLYSGSKVDKRSLLIQSSVLVISSLSFLLMSWEPWVGMLLLPAVVVVLIAEIWAIFRKKYEKS